MFSQKRIFNLLSKKNVLAQQERQQLLQALQKLFFKSLLTPIDLDKLFQQIMPIEWAQNNVIYMEGDKIDRYYFLLDGEVNLYRGYTLQYQQLYSFRNSCSLIGQYFIHNNATRNQTAVCVDRMGARGFYIDSQNFKLICSDLIKEYEDLKFYLGKILDICHHILSKSEIYYHVRYETYNYNHQIIPDKSIYIIVEGQCLMSIRKKYTNATIPKMKPIVNFIEEPILKLCQNDCINLNNYYQGKQQYIYTVKSQNILLLVIPFSSVQHFPPELQSKIRGIYKAHEQKKQQNQQNAERILEISPKKNFSTYASPLKKKSINKVDLNITKIRKQYCLALSKEQNCIRQPRKKKNITQVPHGYFRENKKEKVQINYQINHKEWKSYLKLPVISHMNKPI